jgi:hypothetical protein
MKIIKLLLLSSILCNFSMGFVETFTGSELDPSVWAYNASEGSGSVYLQDGFLNFTTNFDGVGQTSVNVGYIPIIPNESFQIDISMENLSLSGASDPNLAVTMGAYSGGNNFIDFGLNPGGEIGWQMRGDGGELLWDSLITSSTSAVFILNYTKEFDVFELSVVDGAVELFSSSVGIGDVSGSMGLVDWNLNGTEGFWFTIWAYSDSGATLASPGELRVDNVSVSIVPEPRFTSIIIGLIVIVFAGRKYRTNRWW